MLGMNINQWVYVVMINLVENFVEKNNVEVFATLSDAKRFVRNDSMDMESKFGKYEYKISKDNVYLYERGHYNANHCTWTILEKDVQ